MRTTSHFPGLTNFRHAVVLIALFVLSGCAEMATTSGGGIGVNRKQYVSSLLSSDEFIESSHQEYAATLTAETEKGALNTDPILTRRVVGIANRIIPYTVVFRPDALSWPWEVNVITSEDLNASCSGRGKVLFYSGLITTLKLTDSEIAAVLGHEISHALREHGRERASSRMSAKLVLTGLGLLGKFNEQENTLAENLTTVAVLLPNSREHEQEADRMGAELMARAGYDPQAAVSVWEKMQQANDPSSEKSAFLSTHPSNEDRIADLRQLQPLVQPLYQAALVEQKNTSSKKLGKTKKAKRNKAR